MAKQLLFDDHARQRMLRGINNWLMLWQRQWVQLAEMSSSTNRSVVRLSHKDGVTVAKEIELEDVSKTWVQTRGRGGSKDLRSRR